MIFCGEIIKVAIKGITKSAQFIKKIQQGIKAGECVAEGAKLAEEAIKVALPFNRGDLSMH